MSPILLPAVQAIISCAGCGRSLPLYVTSPGITPEHSEPVACEVCETVHECRTCEAAATAFGIGACDRFGVLVVR